MSFVLQVLTLDPRSQKLSHISKKCVTLLLSTSSVSYPNICAQWAELLNSLKPINEQNFINPSEQGVCDDCEEERYKGTPLPR